MVVDLEPAAGTGVREDLDLTRDGVGIHAVGGCLGGDRGGTGGCAVERRAETRHPGRTGGTVPLCALRDGAGCLDV